MATSFSSDATPSKSAGLSRSCWTRSLVPARASVPASLNSPSPNLPRIQAQPTPPPAARVPNQRRKFNNAKGLRNPPRTACLPLRQCCRCAALGGRLLLAASPDRVRPVATLSRPGSTERPDSANSGAVASFLRAPKPPAARNRAKRLGLRLSSNECHLERRPAMEFEPAGKAVAVAPTPTYRSKAPTCWSTSPCRASPKRRSGQSG